MNWHILTRSEGLGVRALGALADIDDEVSISMPDCVGRVKWNPKHDAVLVYDSLAEWLTVRLQVDPKVFVCAISTHFADLCELSHTHVGFEESGIHALFTNCLSYRSGDEKVQHGNLPAVNVDNKGEYVGTVLPDIEDRDFSLLKFAHDEYVGPFRIFIHEGIRHRLPFVPKAGVLVTYPAKEEGNAYRSLHTYVPVPRVTDYVGHVVPPEWGHAEACGCNLLMVMHPAYANLATMVSPCHRSLTELRETLKNPSRITMVEHHRLHSDPDLFVSRIRKAYEDWLDAAA